MNEKNSGSTVRQVQTPEETHAMALLGADAAKKKKDKCKGLEIVITCKPQLVSCDPVASTPCDPVVIVIK
jgi:hypothetical protein